MTQPSVEWFVPWRWQSDPPSACIARTARSGSAAPPSAPPAPAPAAPPLVEHHDSCQCPTCNVGRDAEALAAIAHAVGPGVAFTAVELVERARADSRLSEALERSAGCPRKTGKLLRRLIGKPLDGLCIERVGVEERGVTWICARWK